VCTTKPQRARNWEDYLFETFVSFAVSFENTNAGAIWATSVIPAKAGIHPLPPLDAGLRRHDESREEPCGAGEAAVSYFVDERTFMDTSW
jgi:hypothetical protein